MHVLELYHGPTFAFKDVARQFLGNLFEALLEDRGAAHHRPRRHVGRHGLGAAIHGLRGKKNVESLIMYPEGRTSRTQELQMITVRAAARARRAIRSGAALGAQFSIASRAILDDASATLPSQVTDPNIHNISLHGTFDDCQAIVKASFNDRAQPPTATSSPPSTRSTGRASSRSRCTTCTRTSA